MALELELELELSRRSKESDFEAMRDLEDRGSCSSSSSRGGVKRSASRLAVRRRLAGGGEVAVVGMGVLLRVIVPRVIVVGVKPGRLECLDDMIIFLPL
jgi:hypothetical protein